MPTASAAMHHFASNWPGTFISTTSLPLQHPKSNGESERVIQTVKVYSRELNKMDLAHTLYYCNEPIVR